MEEVGRHALVQTPDPLVPHGLADAVDGARVLRMAILKTSPNNLKQFFNVGFPLPRRFLLFVVNKAELLKIRFFVLSLKHWILLSSKKPLFSTVEYA